MPGEPKKGKSKTPALDSFGRDLTEIAKQDKLDPLIEVLRRPVIGMNRLLEAVEHPHFVSTGQQGIGRMGSDETGASCDECSHQCTTTFAVTFALRAWVTMCPMDRCMSSITP